MATPPTGNPEGRPSLYRPEYCELVQEEMAKGFSLGGFAGLIGVGRQTIADWTHAHPEFAEAVSAAKTRRLRQWETAAMKSAFTTEGGSPTTIIFALKKRGLGRLGRRHRAQAQRSDRDIRSDQAVG